MMNASAAMGNMYANMQFGNAAEEVKEQTVFDIQEKMRKFAEEKAKSNNSASIFDQSASKFYGC